MESLILVTKHPDDSISHNRINIKPFTLLFGMNGSGKRFLMRVLYFFRCLPEGFYLMDVYDDDAIDKTMSVWWDGILTETRYMQAIWSRDNMHCVKEDEDFLIQAQNRILSFEIDKKHPNGVMTNESIKGLIKNEIESKKSALYIHTNRDYVNLRSSVSGSATKDTDWLERYADLSNHPLVELLHDILIMQHAGELTDDFTVYIEEPEIGLHPSLVLDMAEIIAYVHNKGIRVVLTTHSLVFLYTINNLIKARSALKISSKKDPKPAIRLQSANVAAYNVIEGTEAVVTDVMEDGLIDESVLGYVYDGLAKQMNDICKRVMP